jgi:hypothetical protein
MLMNVRVSRALAVLTMVVALIAHGHAATSGLTLAVTGRASGNVSIAARGTFVAAVWSASASSGDTDIYVATSRDSGRSFSGPVRVNSTPNEARVNREQPPRVALKDRPGQLPQIAVVWTAKGTAGTRILTASSTDGGQTFSKSAVVPGTDAPGNRGWEAIGLGPGGGFFSVWLDHRQLSPPQDSQAAGQHQHESGANMPAAMGAPKDAQLSQLYVAPLDGSIAPQAVTGGVCYCCKTAIAAGSGTALYLAWRHVYPGNMRDIAFTVSRDGGKTFASPVRVSEDKWQIDGCPEDGPSMAVDPRGTVHIVWPTVVTEGGGPVKALFHSMTRDGKAFTPRERIPTEGQAANHPQVSIDAAGTLAVTWDEAASGVRRLASAVGHLDSTGRIRFARQASTGETGVYPVLASVGAGSWVRAWTAGSPDSSAIKVGPLN